MSENPFAAFTAWEEPPADDEPEQAPVRWQPKAMVDVPAEMVLAVAVGMEPPEEIAARFGFDVVRWAALAAWEPFQLAVRARRAELEQSGYTFRLKSAMRADMLADQVFIESMGNDATLGQKMEAMRTFARLGDLEPKAQATAAAQGSGFSITINIPPPAAAAPAPLVERVQAPEDIEVDLGDLEP